MKKNEKYSDSAEYITTWESRDSVTVFKRENGHWETKGDLRHTGEYAVCSTK